MEININNYEIFIIDYLDNKLSPFETAQLIVFLEQHPHLKAELKGLDKIKVTPSSDDFFGFEDVIMQPNDFDAISISLKNYSYYFVAATEGDLSYTGNQNLYNFLKNNPQLEKEFNLFSNCKLTPGKKLTFKNKASLKKHLAPAYFKMFTNAAIAASVLILMSIFIRVEPDTLESLDKIITERANISTETKVISITKEEKVINKPNTSDNEINKELKSMKKISPSSKISTEVKSMKNESKANDTPINKMEKLKYNVNYTGLITENQTKNFYTNLYEDIKLSQELAMANREEQDLLNSTNKTQTSNKTGRILNSIILSGNQVVEQVPESLSGWLIADLGIEGFNLLTNNNFKIERQFSSKGNIKSLKLKNLKEKL